jgi:hypothetical protein
VAAVAAVELLAVLMAVLAVAADILLKLVALELQDKALMVVQVIRAVVMMPQAVAAVVQPLLVVMLQLY